MKSSEPIPPELFNVIKYLRNSKESALRARQGIINGKRVDFFKGKSAVNALLRPSYNSSKRPPVNSPEEAVELLSKLLPYQHFLPCKRIEETKNLSIDPTATLPTTFDKESYFIWIYQGSEFKTLIGGILVVLIIFAVVLFPLWPYSMRVGVSYLSNFFMVLIGLLVVVSILRLVVWLLTTVACKRGLWIFPNLYADVGFFDSFKPFMAWEDEKAKGKESKKDQ